MILVALALTSILVAFMGFAIPLAACIKGD
jgi:hypothetical protein